MGITGAVGLLWFAIASKKSAKSSLQSPGFFVKESTGSVYVAQSNGFVKLFSTASGTTNPSLTIDLTAKSTALTCITQDGTTTDLFVGTNGKGIIRFIATEKMITRA